MSIERQLSEAFKRNEARLECPPSLDARIMADYRRVMDKRGLLHMKKKRRLPKAAMIALVVVLLCGFAYGGTRMLFSDSLGQFAIRVQTNDAFHLEPEALEHARTSIKEVQERLAPGETAVVYLPDVFAEMPGDPPAIGATKLQWISDAEQWRAYLEERGLTGVVPDAVGQGQEAYRFSAGAANSPFHFAMGMDALDLLKEMQAESGLAEGELPLWRVTDNSGEQAISFYTTLFRNADGEGIYLTLEVVNGDYSIKKDIYTAPSTEYEEMELNGLKAHYTKNVQSLFGESNILQAVSWIEEKDGSTIVYQVESDSSGMIKERLIEIAQSLL